MQKERLDSVWYTDGIRRVGIGRSVLDQLAEAEQDIQQKESGGILLGLLFENHDEILTLGKPSRTDKRGLLSFLRRRSPAQRRINSAWNKSGGYVVYFGEWHTHPGHDPTPSRQDLDMIKNAVLSTEMEINHLYLIIAGTNGSYWVGRQKKRKLEVLKLENEGI